MLYLTKHHAQSKFCLLSKTANSANALSKSLLQARQNITTSMSPDSVLNIDSSTALLNLIIQTFTESLVYNRGVVSGTHVRTCVTLAQNMRKYLWQKEKRNALKTGWGGGLRYPTLSTLATPLIIVNKRDFMIFNSLFCIITLHLGLFQPVHFHGYV